MPGRTGAELAGLIDESKEDRAPWEREWDVCRHYLRGRQHLRFDRQRQDFAPLSADRLRGRTVTNLIGPRARSITSKLQVVYPSIGINPAGGSYDNITKALANEQILRYYWGVERLKYTIGDVIGWTVLTGTSGLLAYYDPKEKRVHSRVIRPYDLYFEAKASSPEESRFRAIRTFVLREELVEAFPEHESDIMTIGDADGDQ